MFAYGPQGMGQPTRQFVGHPMVPLKQPMALGQPMGQPMALNQPLSQATHFMPQQAAMPISRQPMTSSFAVLPRATSPLRPQSPRLQLSTSCSMLRSPEPSPRLVVTPVQSPRLPRLLPAQAAHVPRVYVRDEARVPSPEPSPRPEHRAVEGEDSLAAQLRALREAKLRAEQMVTEGEELRRQQLNMPDSPDPPVTGCSLQQALSRWPCPDDEDDMPFAPPEELEPELEVEAPSAEEPEEPEVVPNIAEEARRCRRALGKIASQISSKDLRDMRRPQPLPPQVQKLLGAITFLLGEDSKVSQLKKILQDSLPKRLSGVDPLSISCDQAQRLRRLLSGSDWQPAAVARVPCPWAKLLAQWCQCLLVFLTRTQPEKDRIKESPEKSQQQFEVQERLRKSIADSKLLVEPDLTKLHLEQLRAVHELTVTRANIGSVVFHGATDCTELDFQDIVLKRGYVLVYPDASKKPPVGEGLNKASTVTMYDCFPPGETIQESEAESYKEKIRQMTEDNSACTFIDYDCLTGIWRFHVSRF